MSKAADKVRDELLKATKVKPQGKKEDDNEFRVRIAQAIADESFSKAKYARLSPAAQKWYEAAVEAAPSGELPNFLLATPLKIGPKVDGKTVVRIGAPKKPAVPTWKELLAMEESDVETLAEAHGVKEIATRTWESYDEAIQFLADKLKIERPKKISIGAKKEQIDEAKKRPSYQKLMGMSAKELDDLAEDNDIDLTSSKAPEFGSLREARLYIADKLGVKPLDSSHQPTGTRVKGSMKGNGKAEKDPMEKYMLKATAQRKMRDAASTISRKIGKLLPAKYREPVRTAVQEALGLTE